MVHNHDLKFHTIDIKAEKGTEKEQPESNSKECETIRKLVNGKE